MTTFKSGSRKTLQLVAAERILGAALRHQSTIFDNDVEADELQEIEEYYNDD